MKSVTIPQIGEILIKSELADVLDKVVDRCFNPLDRGNSNQIFDAVGIKQIGDDALFQSPRSGKF